MYTFPARCSRREPLAGQQPAPFAQRAHKMEQHPNKAVEGEAPPEGQVNPAAVAEPAADAAVLEAAKGVDALGIGSAENSTKSSPEATTAAGVASVVGQDGQTPGSQAVGAAGAGAAAEAADGKGGASDSAAGGAPPCAQEQERSDDRAVLQVLFET